MFDTSIGRISLVVAVIAFGGGHGVQAQSTPPIKYKLIQFGTLDDPGSSTCVRRMNSLEEISGGYKRLTDRNKLSSAFILSSTGFDDVPTPQSTDSSVLNGINDRGEVVGSLNGDITVHPFRAERKKGFRELPLLNGDTGGTAYAINDKGEAVGYSSGSSGVNAVWWTRKGEIHVLQPLQVSTTTQALGSNDDGDIVGVSGNADPKTAVLWLQKGDPRNIGTLPGFISSEAVSISNSGEIVGFATGTSSSTTLSHAVLWTPGGQSIADLGTLPGGDASRARDVETIGGIIEVVGSATIPSGNRAFLWTSATGMVDLNTLVSAPELVLIDAVSINRKGAIVALGIDANNLTSELEEHELPRRVVVLRPIP